MPLGTQLRIPEVPLSASLPIKHLVFKDLTATGRSRQGYDQTYDCDLAHSQPKLPLQPSLLGASHRLIPKPFGSYYMGPMTVTPLSTTFVADPELLSELEKISCAASIGPDRVLFRQGAPAHGLFIIKKGSAKLTLKSSRKILLQTLVSANSLLGVPAVVGSQPYTLTATALKDAEIAFVPREDFSRLIAASPQLMLKVVALLAGEVRSARQHLSEI